MRFSASLLSGALSCLLAASSPAQDIVNPPQGEQITGPRCQAVPDGASMRAHTCRPEDHAAWLRDAYHWRDEQRARIGFDPTEYARPELLWTQRSFIQPQMMVHDRFFYDPEAQSYTVARYLADLNTRYGAIDSVLIWHTYSNIGIDDRNQFDLFGDLPGGIEAVRRMVDRFHQAGVKVLFPVMVWDRGTRDEGAPFWQTFAQQLVDVGADGVNGDTMDGIPRLARTASDALHHPLALEPEAGLATDEMINYNGLSWGYWNYGFIPTISRYKWLESRHMVHICNRWAHNHLDDLQFAFFNGIGFETWENIWGIWNQLTPRDAEAVRRIALLERAFSDLLVSAAWQPHIATLNFGVFASEWPAGPRTLWTIVNRNHYPVLGEQLRVPVDPTARYFDLWHGIELKPALHGNEATLAFPIEGNGYAAILKTATLTPADDRILLQMKAFAGQPLNDLSEHWTSLEQSLVPIAPTRATSTAPPGMLPIPAGDFNFRVNGVEIEGMNDEGVDVQYPGETSARRFHDHAMHVPALWFDRFNVTNADFKKFLLATHYQPADPHNFLRDWHAGTYPDGWANKPVTWVSLEDARSYAHWAGKRLPHEWEWQYAAGAADGRHFPWGNCDWLASATNLDGLACAGPRTLESALAPIPDRGRTMLPPSDTNAHPNGHSPFGVEDLVGNVWQWTDEFEDTHTRAAILRGGSHYQPQGSAWYFPQAYQLSEHGKYLLMAPALDRSGAIGFRCVADRS